MSLRKGVTILTQSGMSQRAVDSLRCMCSTSSMYTSSVAHEVPLNKKGSEAATVDPFLAKLQNETENELRQLLTQRMQAEEEQAVEEEEEEEVTLILLSSCNTT